MPEGLRLGRSYRGSGAGHRARAQIGVAAFALAAGLAAAEAPPRSENSVLNGQVDTGKHWTFLGDAAFDPTRSRGSGGSGAVRLVTPYRGGSRAAGQVDSDFILVRASEKYTYGFYLKTASGPSYVTAQVRIHDAERNFLRNLESMRCGTAEDGRWEECAIVFTVPAGASFVRVQAIKAESPRGRNRAWVDDFYLRRGFALEGSRAAKRPFAGSEVRIDALGNFDIRRGEDWVPFFPLGIYADDEGDWQAYSRQGWNTVMRVSTADEVARARAAVSKLNPFGLLAGFSITPYTMPESTFFADVGALRSRLAEIFRRGLSSQLLLYHWDNERHHEQWRVPAQVIRSIQRLDVDAAKQRRRPVYALQGTYGVARTHAARGLTDVTGTYVGGVATVDGSGAGAVDSFRLLDGIEHQTNPVAFAQFNRVTGAGDLRLRLYNSLLVGARGIGYWRDCVGAPCRQSLPDLGPIDAAAWWPDVPRLRREIDALLPVLREPHWTSWTATSEDPERVRVGSREHQGEAFVILVNQTLVAQKVTLRLSGLPDEIDVARDFFDGGPVARVSDHSLELAVPGLGVGRGTLVLRLTSAR